MSRAASFAITALLATTPLFAAFGDNAPPLPPTYKTQHPRLPAPDAAYLQSLAANSTALAAYNATADQWDSKNPSGAWQLRRLLIAYMANKIANPAKAAAYLDKIKALAYLGGTWAKLQFGVDDGVGNGTYTVTSASANFLTGCGGASCAGNVLAIGARTYNITSVTAAGTVVLSDSNPTPNGTNLKFRVFSGNLTVADLNLAIIYDWLYNDFDADTRTEFMNQIEALCTIWEEGYVGLKASPYNDVFYVRMSTFGLVGALAIHPDHPNSTKHIRFMTDVWFNVLFPVWRQVFGPEGGGWHESWTDYVRAASGNGLTTFLVPSLLSWQTATGDPIFTREAWLKNFAYFTMYMMRPDYVMESIGDVSRGYIINESPALGSLHGLGEIYNDPVIRGWARLVNSVNPSSALDGFEPSAWPFYRPDRKENPVTDRSPLSRTRNFTGWGLLSMRTGWTEDDTSFTLKYGDNFWSHEHFDVGGFTLFSRGALALDSGSYRAGSLSKHQNQYARQTIAHNSLTITDPADDYPSTTFLTYDEFGKTVYLPVPNDGGQRRAGTLYNSRFPQFESPKNIGDWLRNWEYYHMGKLVAYSPTDKYTYAAVDITAAYNNKHSITTPNASNRTYRVEKAVRHVVFIPRGTSAYVVIFDQVTSTNASFVKRWIMHTVNQPVISGNKFEVTRSELVTSLPFPDLWPYRFRDVLKYDVGTGSNRPYQYNGKLHGWMVQPQAGDISTVGGPGKEFWIEDPLKPGTGTNWNQCMLGQCAANVEGLGSVDNFINPDPKTAPHEPGSWRIEIKPGAASKHDLFLHVMLATSATDTNVPVTVTAPANLPAGMVGASWQDAERAYTVIFTADGIGGRITASGWVDEDLLTYAQQLPDTMEMVSGTAQSGAAGAQLASPLVVLVKDKLGKALPNAAVHFGVTKGAGRLVTDMAVTDATGHASAALVLGSGAAGSTVEVVADVNGLEPVLFTATIGSAGNAPASLTCSPTALASGGTSNCTVVLTQPAAAAAAVSVSSSNTLLSVPATVTVAAGATSAAFTATAVLAGAQNAVTTTQNAVITATLNGTSRTATVSLAPTTSTVTVSSLVCAPTDLPSTGGKSVCTITLSQTASSIASVAVTSSTASLTVPTAVSVPAGASSATFETTAAPAGTLQSASVTAAFGGVSRTASLRIGVSSAVVLSSVSCAPTTLTSAAKATCSVTLSGPAPSGGATITLGSSSAVLTVPASATVASGATAGQFVASAGTVSTNQAATITATLAGVSLSTAMGLAAPGTSGVPIPENSWTMVPTNGFPVAVVGYSNLIYAPGIKKFVMWENYHNLTSESNQAMLAYDFTSNRWDVWGLNGNFHSEQLPESGHPVGMLQYNPNQQTFISYCCHSGSQGYDRPQRTWVFDPIGLVGRDVQTPTMPGLATEAQAAFDVAHNVYVLFEIGAGTWIYDPVQNSWTKMTPKGTVPTTSGWFGAMTYNNRDQKVYLFGGIAGSAYANDLFTYDVPTNTWTKLNPSGTVPSGRKFPGFAYDSLNNVFLMFGGQNASGILNDTWIYDPAANTWTEMTPASVPPPAPQAVFQRLAYDPDDNVFMIVWIGPNGYANGPSVGYAAAQAWFYRYKGPGPNAGTTNRVFSPTPGSINRNNDAWANEPVLASTGSTLYAGWIETSRPFETGNQYFPHVYASQFSNSSWTPLGGSFLALDSEFAGFDEAHEPSISVVGGTPWISWYKTSNNGRLLPHSLYAKYWNGSAWIGGPVGGVDTASKFIIQSRSQLAAAGSVPYIAFLENNRKCYPWCQFLYVKQWDGSSWTLTGAGPLNRETLSATASPRADSVSITSDGSRPIVAWVESTQASTFRANTPPQVYVSRWNGTTWDALGGSLNVSPANWASDASIAWFKGQPYVAWVERNQIGTLQVYAKTWNGSSWALIGSGSLNKDTNTGWAFRPTLIGDDATNSLLLGWVEQQSLGQKAKTYVLRYQNGAWAPLGGSLNADPEGSAERVALAVFGGQPVVAWGEVKAGSLRQIYVRQWTGSTWSPLTANPSPPSAVSCDVNRDGSVNVADVQAAVGQTLGSTPCSTADLQQNGKCDAIDVQRVVNATLGHACVTGP